MNILKNIELSHGNTAMENIKNLRENSVKIPWLTSFNLLIFPLVFFVSFVVKKGEDKMNVGKPDHMEIKKLKKFRKNSVKIPWLSSFNLLIFPIVPFVVKKRGILWL